MKVNVKAGTMGGLSAWYIPLNINNNKVLRLEPGRGRLRPGKPAIEQPSAVIQTGRWR